MYLFIGIEVLNFGILLKKSNTYLVKKILIFKKISILLVQGDIYVILHVLKKDNCINAIIYCNSRLNSFKKTILLISKNNIFKSKVKIVFNGHVILRNSRIWFISLAFHGDTIILGK